MHLSTNKTTNNHNKHLKKKHTKTNRTPAKIHMADDGYFINPFQMAAATLHMDFHRSQDLHPLAKVFRNQERSLPMFGHVFCLDKALFDDCETEKLVKLA